ncbi:YaeQ family protein [Thalassotalea sp. LPB0316]|uniref:YaeQ family protein n=1 Tax=Thalassotalea sp. LPB0316 TaxID=2769490 RepID=UPI00186755CE|nr:YaeQ family protein [Thalassotalea sp. LPB0316]QOL25657.1 YaeQ family protein [Thalassotalea sp. LPB0316]
MALKATIFKVDLSISDMDKHYYADHALTIARHPSESDKRMMLRIIAFAFNAHEQLEFTKGLSDVDTPDLWQKNYSGEIELWIELGQPSEQRIKKGCNQAVQMMVYSYDNNAFDEWWKKEQNALNMRKNLTITTVSETTIEQLADLVERQMQIQVTIQDGQAWFSVNNQTIEVSLNKVKEV